MARKFRVTRETSIPETELRFGFARSGGPGGQHVNKVSTRVEVRFDVLRSRALTDEQKQSLSVRLKGRLGSHGLLRVSSQESRSQWQNRERAIEKLIGHLQEALAEEKHRTKTGPTEASRVQKSETKKLHSRTKKLRRRIRPENETE